MEKTLEYFEENFKEKDGYRLSLNYNCDGSGKIDLYGWSDRLNDKLFIKSFLSWIDCLNYLKNIKE
jgi:hypothetical protein